MHALRPIVCFSSNDWDDIPSSKIHIMRHLGQRRSVLYLETIGIRSPRADRRDLARIGVKIRRFISGLDRVEGYVHVCTPLAIPYHGSRVVQAANDRVLAAIVRSACRRLRLRDPIVWTYVPHVAPTIERLGASSVIYHCIDDYGAFTGAPAQAFATLERRMLATADLTVVSAERLRELRGPYARRIEYVPHGVDVDRFAVSSSDHPLPDIDALPSPRAGFVGRVADWIDLPLVADIATQMPDWSFAMIGPSNVDLENYARVPNLHFLGGRPYDAIPHYLARFDVALMPFVDNAVTASVNPLKLYEYLAAGKPVVTVPMREVEAFAHVVHVARPDEFAATIRRAAESDNPMAQAARREAVGSRSWGLVADEILTLLPERSPRSVGSDV